MKLAGALLLLAVATGCADLYDVDPAYAARADSSAAGYVVGVIDDDAVRPRVVSSRAPRSTTTPRQVRDSQPEQSPASSGAARAPAPAPPDIQPAPAAVPRDSIVVADTGAPKPDVATLPPELAAPVDDSIVVNSYLAFNPAARMVWIDLIAGFDGTNGALNFNGGHAGAHTVVVPLGWRVEVRIANRDHDLSHSAIVVRDIDPIPVMAPPAAFPGAFSIALEEGLVEGRSDVFRFSADREGRYMMMCAVPGHAETGMWLHLDVTSTLTSPEYRR